MLDNFQEVVVKSPIDIIIHQIKDLIHSGQLKPGDRLPAERKLAEKMGVSRTHVREALRKLEFYGILRTLPQSGTIVSGLGITALEGLISDVLQLENNDFAALIETRVLLETHAAKLAAQRRTLKDITALQEALNTFKEKVESGKQAVEEDLMFHLKIAEACKNNVLKSLMLIITPDIINNFVKLDVCQDTRHHRSILEHKEILHYIIEKDDVNAGKAMRAHLKDVIDYSKSLKRENGL